MEVGQISIQTEKKKKMSLKGRLAILCTSQCPFCDIFILTPLGQAKMRAPNALTRLLWCDGLSECVLKDLPKFYELTLATVETQMKCPM